MKTIPGITLLINSKVDSRFASQNLCNLVPEPDHSRCNLFPENKQASAGCCCCKNSCCQTIPGHPLDQNAQKACEKHTDQKGKSRCGGNQSANKQQGSASCGQKDQRSFQQDTGQLSVIFFCLFLLCDPYFHVMVSPPFCGAAMPQPTIVTSPLELSCRSILSSRVPVI